MLGATESLAWVTEVNAALESSAISTLCSFMLVDVGSAMGILGVIVALDVRAPPELVMAYAVSKGLLRVPRMTLDAGLAAVLARRWPSLAAVRISLLVDAAAKLSPRWPCGKDTKKPPSKMVAQARAVLDQYGLAYMAAKNIIGPTCILSLCAALRRIPSLTQRLGLGQGKGASVTRLAGQLALASTASTLLFPAVVLAAAKLGPALHRVASKLANIRPISGRGDTAPRQR